MSWIIYALVAALLTAGWGLSLEFAGKTLPKGIDSNLIYMALVFVLSGIIAAMGLVYYYYNNKKLVSNIIEKKINYPVFLLSPIVLIGGMIFLQLGLSGGGAAQAIVNFNMFIILIASAFLFQHKLNLSIIVSIIVAIISSSYVAIESDRINKKK